jgi:hypothetical protein
MLPSVIGGPAGCFDAMPEATPDARKALCWPCVALSVAYSYDRGRAMKLKLVFLFLLCGLATAARGGPYAFSISVGGHGVAEHQRGAMSKFKIGQALIFRKGSVKLSGRYVVLAILPEPPGKARYRIRSQDDGRTEYVAEERELSTA